jgi:hypothetical protein
MTRIMPMMIMPTPKTNMLLFGFKKAKRNNSSIDATPKTKIFINSGMLIIEFE